MSPRPPQALAEPLLANLVRRFHAQVRSGEPAGLVLRQLMNETYAFGLEQGATRERQAAEAQREVRS